jgi:hypothetical protein
MLVSVLVDRYQRVFARKLYINEEVIDFDDYSDEENNDTDSKSCGSGQLHRRNVKEIQDPDARARANAAFQVDDHDITEIPDVQIINETPLSRNSSRVHFIIGYVDDQKHETSLDLLETISSVVANKQSHGDNIHLSIISDEQQRQQASQNDVKFKVSMSSEEEDTDDDQELTEIVSGRGNRGNVLKKFQCPPSPETNKQLNKTEKRV